MKGSPITKEDIEQHFKGLTLDEQQLNMIYNYIADVKTPDSDTILNKKEEEDDNAFSARLRKIKVYPYVI